MINEFPIGYDILNGGGAGMVIVPYVIGDSLSEALSAIAAVSLVNTVVTDYSDTTEQGLIAAQSPAPLTMAAIGSVVTVTMSLGPASVPADSTTTTTNMLRTGTAWLAQQRATYCSNLVDYCRPPDSYEVYATYGDTRVEITDETGLTIVAKVWDFVIQAEELDIEPEAGDVIIADGQRYEIMNLGGEAWRFSDPYRTAYRIHTKHIGIE